MNRKKHWDRIYSLKTATELGWYQPHLKVPLELIRCTGIARSSSIIDVGGGLSTLAGDLLQDGFEEITVLDVSSVSIQKCKQSLGEREKLIKWVEGDITKVSLNPLQYDLWHDRAVFHFLTACEDRTAYIASAECALRPGGYLIIGTFSLYAPPRCSGLDVVRYSPISLKKELGDGFTLVHVVEEPHITPWGAQQDYIFCLLKRNGTDGDDAA